MFKFPSLRGFKKLKGFKGEIEPQEIFLDKLAQKKEEELGLSERKIEVLLSENLLRLFYLSFLILMLVFLGKTLQLQIFNNEEFFLRAEENKLRVYQVRPNRGIIYDQNLKQLIWNESSFDLVLDKRDFPWETPEKEEILEKVSSILQITSLELEEKIMETESLQVLIKENISHEILVLLETKIDELLGFQIEKNIVRDYLQGPTFAHLIGFTGKINSGELKNLSNYTITDYLGKQGLEKEYEETLRGEPGRLEILKDARNQVLSQTKVSDPQPGQSLVLWLDSELQEKVQEELTRTLLNSGTKKGAAIALDPKTGGVLAMVSLPTFNNNSFSKGMTQKEYAVIQNNPSKPLFNRVVAGQYATGSTIKPIVAAAALQEEIIDPKKLIFDPGFLEIEDQYNPEKIWTFLDWKVHDWTDMRKAIAQSCNVYFYIIGGGYKEQEGLGPTRIKEYLSLFGWGKTTQIDLPGEKKGLLPDPDWKKEVKNEGWWDGDTYHLSIGQGDVLATPLQVASSFVAIANQGKLLEPKIVQKVVNQDKKLVREIDPEILNENFIDQENLQVVREGMREAVIYGSSVLLSNLPVKAAAKTGTAQTPKENYYHNWITVFAPYDDPEIVLTIIIESVYGEQVAALPVAKEVLSWYFR
ncbi:MAG TPA: penicillin-binding protein 2 [Candidatus Parcubacteria bacterium]|nr:penicillin-binding protein 2 [Candidatus Parcubacteria bacterium]